MRFVLASASPARLALLQAAGVEPEVVVSGIDEDTVTGPPGELALVLAESCLIACLGGGIGFAIGAFLVSLGDPTKGALPIFYIPTQQIVLGVALIFILGLVTGALPALQARRLRIVDALRRA